jgi:hypothetical protein
MTGDAPRRATTTVSARKGRLRDRAQFLGCSRPADRVAAGAGIPTSPSLAKCHRELGICQIGNPEEKPSRFACSWRFGTVFKDPRMTFPLFERSRFARARESGRSHASNVEAVHRLRRPLAQDIGPALAVLRPFLGHRRGNRNSPDGDPRLRNRDGSGHRDSRRLRRLMAAGRQHSHEAGVSP